MFLLIIIACQTPDMSVQNSFKILKKAGNGGENLMKMLAFLKRVG